MDNINLNRENGQKLWAADWNKLVSTINLIIDAVNNQNNLPGITKLSQLINDSGFITQEDVKGKVNKGELAEVATSGSYNDLKDKPSQMTGPQGPEGKSAYQVAVQNGFIGTPQLWLNSLKGEPGQDGVIGLDGADGKSAYDLAVELGYEGTLELWLESLHGLDGTNGLDGQNGLDGITPSIDPITKHWMVGETDTNILAEGVNGQDGVTPHIDSTTGNWFIGNTDTGVKAHGFSGDYNDLFNKPTIPDAQIQSDWNQSDNTAKDYIKNKPSLFSGSYTDLTDKPSIPAAQIQADWNRSNSSALDYIKNKPNLAEVAISGSYRDLTKKPIVPEYTKLKKEIFVTPTVLYPQNDEYNLRVFIFDFTGQHLYNPFKKLRGKLGYIKYFINNRESHTRIIDEIKYLEGGSSASYEEDYWRFSMGPYESPTDNTYNIYIETDYNQEYLKNIEIYLKGDIKHSELEGVTPCYFIFGEAKFIINSTVNSSFSLLPDWKEINKASINYIKNKPGYTIANGHDYVEIGGIKWATMNVGANNVTDIGDLYFLWGDTQGYTADLVGNEEGKKYFGWDDYKFRANTNEFGFTKYGEIDGKLLLEDSDDAVTAAWGGNWRLPTKREIEILLDSVTFRPSIYGLYLVDKTDPNKELLFPYGGWVDTGNVEYNGVNDAKALYMSKELHTETTWDGDSRYIDTFYIESYAAALNCGERHLGCLVRGVLDDLNDFSTVAFTGDYNDLINKPTIPASSGTSTQIQADWDLSDNTALDYIKNKPTIPAALVLSDWNATTGMGVILNKPTIPDAQIQSDWNQTNTSSKDYIKNKPSSMPASDVSAWAKAANKPKYIKSEVGLGNVTNDAQVKRTEMGVASGVATLGSDGKVPASQLPSGVDPTVNKTWAELKAMRDGGTLVPGQWYRITDYTCTTTQENTQSAGHVFDVIVRADGVNVLNENAYAALHSGDTYFSASTLEAWELKYCLDNDTDRFMWADTTNGKGVIFYMKDEFANECPYDFKNIMFERWRASAITTSSTAVTSDMVESLEVIFVDHYHSYQSSNMSICDGKATVVIDSSDSKFFYTFSLCTDDWETFESDDNSTVADGSLKGYGDNMYTSNVIGELIPFDEGYSYKLNNIVFKPIDSSADDCGNNVFGKGCYNITLGFSWTVNNTFGNYCNSNTFGNECGGNTFGNYCNSNTFGNECGGNTFGNYFQYNTFGNNNYNNTFGNNNYNNTFGNECYYNSFGNNCYDNMFGNECYDNTFGKGCQHIVFSKDYCYYNIVENGNQYITLTSTQTTSDSNKLRNITIAQGSNNTTTPKTISHNTVNDTFQTEYKPANSQVISV